jgi:hypothetical protein
LNFPCGKINGKIRLTHLVSVNIVVILLTFNALALFFVFIFLYVQVIVQILVGEKHFFGGSAYYV